MQRIYGPPPNAPRRRNEPRVPRSVSDLRAASRRPRFIAAVAGIIGVVLFIIVMLVALFSPPPPPALNEPGEPFHHPVLTFQRPGFWVPWVPDAELVEPIVLFAPQEDPADPPTTITIAVLNVTDDVTEIIGVEGGNSISTVELLTTLVAKWATEADRGAYEVEEASYNVIDAQSDLALAGIIVRWAEPTDWTPLPIDDPALRPLSSPTPTPAPGEAPPPTPEPTPAPVPSAVPGVQVYQWQMLGLPTDRNFTENGQRHALTVTLTWPSTLSEERVGQAQEAFAALVSSIQVGE